MNASPSAPQENAVELLRPGYRLNRYELLYPLARGGMGQIWVARLQTSLGFEKLFALKVILPVHAADARFRTMFLDEARIASGIEHPNVVQIFDLGEHEGTLYLVMEYVEGDSINAFFRHCMRDGTSRLPLPIALRLVSAAAEGLHAAHELRDSHGMPLEVVHRDVSPQNLILSTRGLVKVVDFGIAKARGRIGGDTTTGSIRGKIRFMAPEQALGERVTRQADIWSLGAILHHVLTGGYPYEADGELGTLKAILAGEAPAEPPADVPESVRRILARALAREASARYPTAAALHSALEAAMTETGARATSTDVALFADTFLANIANGRRAALEDAERTIALERASATTATAPETRAPSLTGTAEMPTHVERHASRDPAVPIESGVRLGVSREGSVHAPNAAEETKPTAAIPAVSEAMPAKRRALVGGAAAAVAALVVAFVLGRGTRTAPPPAATPTATTAEPPAVRAAEPLPPEPSATKSAPAATPAPAASNSAAPAHRAGKSAPAAATARKEGAQAPSTPSVPARAPKDDPPSRTLDMELK